VPLFHQAFGNCRAHFSDTDHSDFQAILQC
jgi:hypothetical protein